jgi:transcription-repair coupling factor (superfamily II helicase)
VKALARALRSRETSTIGLEKLCGSAPAFIAASVLTDAGGNHLFVLNSTEEAIYFYNDLENLLQGKGVLYYPAGSERHSKDSLNPILLGKTEVLRAAGSGKGAIIVTAAQALCELVPARKAIDDSTLTFSTGDSLSMEFVAELLAQYRFARTDFVNEPGQYSRRGGILDIFSFSNDNPYRIEFSGDKVESIRTFDAITQLSIATLDSVSVTPSIHIETLERSAQSFLAYLASAAETTLWIKDAALAPGAIAGESDRLRAESETPGRNFLDARTFEEESSKMKRIAWGLPPAQVTQSLVFNTVPQKSFGKNFQLFFDELNQSIKNGYRNFIFTDTRQQVKRLQDIFAEVKLKSEHHFELEEALLPVSLSVHEGFTDRDIKISVYTDHGIFGRYHRYKLQDKFYKSKEALTIRELRDLKPGDYVTHVDHGIGRFAGLEKIEVNGNRQEAMRIMYKDNDLLYVSIHSLHRVMRYTGKESHVPKLDKLGSASWKTMKQKTRGRLKLMAFDLVKLYARRKALPGFAFSPDTFMQTELEASFIYEDTADQVKATADVKKDMESPHPMDRLICGDVGFGKTEIAIRAAFKAVADNKQVAVLAPTTILALQHYHTFSDRLKGFPCTIDYLNRFRTASQKKEIMKKLAERKIDIIIGTHQLANKDVTFKDLGLLIVDEEQKFGVGVKDKLKNMRTSLDILTLTATPIPRTLQFSLIGVRDLSVINTPPPNRYPVQTELCTFNDTVIKKAINFELGRGGQVFVIHNRIQTIGHIAEIIQSLCPKARIAVAHGQLNGNELESIMMRFVQGELDVLVSTAIVESGLDIPNLNTIIINDAHLFGLSDLHQLRGRVGRSTKKAFCYMVSPPQTELTDEARKRLETIERFSDLGSGFSIAMRDLDIRGAGDLLGAEQSGFISEMGVEMYYKVLNEAIEELKEEMPEIQAANYNISETASAGIPCTLQHGKFVKDCQLETDAEALIPDDYVQSGEERLRLYRELDDAADETAVLKFENEMKDRFGNIPPIVQKLTDIVRLRLIAIDLGIERIVYKNKTLICFFVSKHDSPYYTSPVFASVVEYVKTHPQLCRMKEAAATPASAEAKLSLTVSGVKDVKDALNTLRRILNRSTEA